MPTRISDILVPEIWVPYLREATAENSRLFTSGAVATDATIDSEIQAGGKSVNIPFWKDLGSDGTVDVVQSDNPATSATLGKIEASGQVAPVLRRNTQFAAADIAASLAGDDPMRVAADRIAPFWSRMFNRVSIASITGALLALENELAGSGIHSVAVASGAPVLVDANAVIDARINTLGDASDSLTLFFVHSRVYGRLQKENLIDFIPDSRGEVMIPTYLGMELVVSDTLPVDTSATNDIYTSYIAGPGALRYGEASARVPTEVNREPRQANGAGVEEFYSRRNFVLHPLGFAYQGAVPDAGPTNAQLEAASPLAWGRVFERKNIPLVGLQTNG